MRIQGQVLLSEESPQFPSLFILSILGNQMDIIGESVDKNGRNVELLITGKQLWWGAGFLPWWLLAVLG